MDKKIYISGMSCMHCVNRVKNSLMGLPGVTDATVDLKGGFALLEAERDIPNAEIKGAVEEAGYEVKSVE